MCKVLEGPLQALLWELGLGRSNKATRDLFLQDCLLPDLRDLCKGAAKWDAGNGGKPTTQLKHFLVVAIGAGAIGIRTGDLRQGIDAIEARTGIKAVVEISYHRYGSVIVSLYNESKHLVLTERMVAK